MYMLLLKFHKLVGGKWVVSGWVVVLDRFFKYDWVSYNQGQGASSYFI